MPRFTFRLPDIGEGIASAEIVAWHVQPGQRIEEDSPLCDVMTDKATVEIETPVAGTLISIGGAPGEAVAIGATLAVFEVDADEDQVAEPVPPETASFSDPEVPPKPQAAPAEPMPEPAAQPAPVPPAPTEPIGKKPLASPAVRARAKALGVDLAAVHADGPHLRHADLDAFLRYGSAQGYRAPNTSSARPDQQIPVIGLRRRIAENMAAAKRAIPHFTYVEEIEVTALETLRAQLNSGRGGHHQDSRPKLTMLPFLITAICRILPEFPMLNARYDDEANVVTRHGAVHIGIATQTSGGLMVPVLRDAQDLNIWQLAAGIARLAAAARDGTAKREDLSGSTITITSLGALGGVATTPVINRPEVAIIGPNRIIERPVFTGQGNAIRRALLMNLSIACDHRVVDGWDAASFVARVKALIEAPGLLLAP